MTMRFFQKLLDRRNLRRQAEDYRAGALCALVANALSSGQGRRYKPSDFFPSLKALDHDRPQTPEEQFAILQHLAASQNARVAAERA